jgi:hypothetical protein
MRLIFYLSTLLAWLTACQQPAANTSGQERSNAGTQGPSFFFSNHVATPVTEGSSDWCRGPFPDAAVINADPANVNRRVFTLSDGPHRVVVTYGKLAASFALQKSGNNIEVFTSDNYPVCLSNKVNFSLQDGGAMLHYDNQRHINFDVQPISYPNGIQIALEMAPGAGYGIEVRR